MNTTAPKKTRIYAVAVSHHPAGLVVDARVFVRAESLAQARNHVAATMINVSPATTDEILDLKRTDLIDATSANDPAQEPLPLADTTTAEPFGDAFLAGIAGRDANPEG